MFQLQVSDSADAFRRDFRDWLARNPAPQGASHASLDEFQRIGREWQRRLSESKWLAVHWPAEYGGRSLSLVEEAIIQEELVRVNAPQVLGLFGLTMVGPVLIKHGTPQQRERYLQRILSADDIWCQGFSEPGAGSDLAAVKTRARQDQNGFYVSGQKVWTSFAHIADFCFLICRTSDESKKHMGLSYLLVDMKSPGISVRPLKQISGDEEFNEVFFDEVFVPNENLVGKAGDGWQIAISTLMYERVVLTFARQIQSEVALRRILSDHASSFSESEIEQFGMLLSDACAVRALAYEHLLHYAAGNAPGPEGSLDKLFWSESFQEIARFALRYHSAQRQLQPEHSHSELEEALHRYLYSRGRTIAAGTSEIQKGIIAERVLGLPRLNYSFK